MDPVELVARDLADLFASSGPATHIVRALRVSAGALLTVRSQAARPAPDRVVMSVFDTMVHVDDELERSVLLAAQDPPTAIRLLVLMRELKRPAPGEQCAPGVERVDHERLRRVVESGVSPGLLEAYARTVAFAYPWAGSRELDLAALYCALRDVVVAGADVQGDEIDARLAREDVVFLDDLLGSAPPWLQRLE